MKRLILNIDESVSEEDALRYVVKVVQEGRISETKNGKQFCFYTVFNENCHVSATKSKTGTETFKIWKNKYK
jgi:hypothetical protein